MSDPHPFLTASQRRYRLIGDLAGRHERLYRMSPTFKAQINTLALILEPMIDGLATQAREADAHRLARLETIELAPWPNPDIVAALRADMAVQPGPESP